MRQNKTILSQRRHAIAAKTLAVSGQKQLCTSRKVDEDAEWEPSEEDEVDESEEDPSFNS
ncbi:hypothetical protein DVH05_012771 [Phytophthora capsici]|nr:hypothetical protein DVH05_012771 [Phytophthora capsici]